MIHQILTGRKPFEGGTVSRTIYQVLYEEPPIPSSLRPGIPPGWDRVLGRLLAKIPEARYPTAGDFLTDLDRLGQKDDSFSTKRRGRILLAAVTLLFVLAILWHRPTPTAEAPSPPAVALPLQFVAQHEHRVGHCTGDLSLAESGLLFEADRHGEWRSSLEQIESLELLSETELELRTKMRGDGETFQFTFLRAPLDPARFHAYRSRVLARDEE